MSSGAAFPEHRNGELRDASSPHKTVPQSVAAKKSTELGRRLADQTVREVRGDRDAKLLALIRLEHQENPEHEKD
jgi:hypothetical protein